MKRSNCIENIKSEINAKINAQTSSERDYIVFRPKSYIFNPILRKQNNNMTSIFQLENRRKNESSLMKIRCKTKQRDQQSVDLEDNLHIQRCKTFKKFRLSKEKYLKSLQTCTPQTPRQKKTKQYMESSLGLKNVRSNRSEKKTKYSILSGIQKKKKFDNLLFNQNLSNLSFQQKENISCSINVNRLKPVKIDEEIAEMINLRLFKEKTFQKDKLKTTISKDWETHKRMQTQIPQILLVKFPEEKYKIPLKSCQNYLQDREKVKQKPQKEQNYAFRPWETTEIFERHEQFLDV